MNVPKKKRRAMPIHELRQLKDRATIMADTVMRNSPIKIAVNDIFTSSSSPKLEMNRDYWATIALDLYIKGNIELALAENMLLVLVALGHDNPFFNQTIRALASASRSETE